MKAISFIHKKNLDQWLDKLSSKFGIYLPVQDTERSIIDYMDWESYKNKSKGKDTFRINFTEKTKKSPKDIFFPSTEKFFDFEYKKDIDNPQEVDIELKIPDKDNSKPKIIFGIKPCDIAGIKRLDKIFGEGDKTDSYYLDKRKNSLFISIGCSNPYPDCFCTLVDGHPFDFENADIGMVEVDDGYAIVKISEEAKDAVNEGREFMSDKDLPEDCKRKIDDAEARAVKMIQKYWGGTKIKEFPEIMDRSFLSDVWEKVTAKCISCAACTYVCPTCFCFNIRDEQKDLKGERYRCWDYCMNSYYTLEASGHNPRQDKSKRYRNKVNCKYNYNIKRNGIAYCVGCGRCIEVCPAGVDIREVVNAVLENDKK